jgi:uncharacterized protein YggE
MYCNLKLFLIILFLQANYLFAQPATDTRKFIEVTGSAEKTIKPDEIELEIVISEYVKDGSTVKLENIEKEFYLALKKNSINTDSLKLNGLESNYWWYWWNNRNKNLKSKTFKLSIRSDINFLKLTEELNKKWVESISIIEKKNKNIQNYRREVKIEAIKAAKEKATYLLESIGEQIGNVISVEEIPDEATIFYPSRNLTSNSILNTSSSETDEISNVSSIKLRYEIKVKFEIR